LASNDQYNVTQLPIIGSGYVGWLLLRVLPGYEVVNITLNLEAIDTLNHGNASVFESGLAELAANCASMHGAG
jgi:UDP-glucose 6-dehydrogenase